LYTSKTNTSDNHFRQLILLNENVELIKSDDLIFSTEKLKFISVKKWFPFIESIYEALRQMRMNDEELIFSKIESPAEFLPGSYDFTFAKVEIEGQAIIQWSIYDYTNVYIHLAKYQQLKNEKDIYRQKLEHRLKNVKKLNQLF